MKIIAWGTFQWSVKFRLHRCSHRSEDTERYTLRDCIRVQEGFCLSVFRFCFFCLFYWDRVSLSPWVAWNTPYSPGWPWTHKDPPDFASQGIRSMHASLRGEREEDFFFFFLFLFLNILAVCQKWQCYLKVGKHIWGRENWFAWGWRLVKAWWSSKAKLWCWGKEK